MTRLRLANLFVICASVDVPLSNDNPTNHKQHTTRSQMNIFRCFLIHFLKRKITTTIVPMSADLDKVRAIATTHNAMMSELISAHLSLKILLSEEILVLKNMMMMGRNATRK